MFFGLGILGFDMVSTLIFGFLSNRDKPKRPHPCPMVLTHIFYITLSPFWHKLYSIYSIFYKISRILCSNHSFVPRNLTQQN